MKSITWTGEGRPCSGDVLALEGAVKVEGWELGDTLEVLEYVGSIETDSSIARCLNITKDEIDYIDTDHLSLPPDHFS
ncbi:hypothetical protein [Pseudomonas helleri]|uniref:Uncharacterized protein n=1 Tax=Pseudomonas helleri TaxID=1608996 RepID=A0A6L5HZ33_9PSED|nr:hypothetical protein [Pseudomonas helleri]MQU08619.1 hypothetical protein [Pseudomonas helleri]